MGNAKIEPPKSISTGNRCNCADYCSGRRHIYGGTTIRPALMKCWHVCHRQLQQTSQDREDWNIPDAEGYVTLVPLKSATMPSSRWSTSKYPAHRQRSDAVCRPLVLVWAPAGESRLIQGIILRNRIAGLGKNRKTAGFPKLVFAIRDGLTIKKAIELRHQTAGAGVRKQAHVSGYPELRSGSESHRFV
ncbi:hypothetical protein ACLK1T_08745 [Escherichia coli]